MGCYRSIAVDDNSFAHNNLLYSYAKYSKYRPTYGAFSINLTKKELIDIEIIEGIPTVKLEKGKAKWLEASGKKHTYDIRWVNGYLYKDSHSTVSFAQAKEIQKKKEAKIVAQQMGNKRFVGLNHIKQLGACDAGISAFCNRHGLNEEFGYNLGYLKSLNDEYGNKYFNKL